jgi:hypothetical protein
MSIDSKVIYDLRICELQIEVAELQKENHNFRVALETIRTCYGQVCEDFELCTHPACQSSYGAWAVADETLSGRKILKERS